jgi:fructose-specific PTS system IIA-like component
MIEVPSMVFALDDLARELDFFSIGSNDLLQYFMAADRGNADVSDLYDPLQPSFLRLLKQAVDGARAQHRKIGLCGEMGNQKTVLPLLAGLGLDEISVAGPVIPALKAALARLSASDCRHLLASALNCGTAEEVAGLLDAFGVQSSAPLLEPELVILNADALTKEEAIKLGVDQLFVLGRTEDPAAVEEAVWQREEIYSTGFGHGFAIPHCKTRALEANSLVVIKLAAPVAWGSLDGQPVRVVLLLVMREKDRGAEHMQVFSRLARQVMHEAFRARLERESDAGKVCEFLREQLQIESAAAQRR